MFDLKKQADASAVPVPLAGRVLVFLNDQAQLMGRLHDGSVIGLGGSGSQGLTGKEGKQGPIGLPGPQGSPGLRNRLINGSFEVWQRGALPAVGGFVADRWFAHVAGAPYTAQRYVFTSGYAIEATGCSVALELTGAAGNTGATLGHRVESVNVRDVAGKIVTLSVWVYSTDIRVVSLVVDRCGGVHDVWSMAFQMGLASAQLVAHKWTRVTVSFNADDLCLTGLQAMIYCGAIGTGQKVYLTGCQLEVSPVPTEFEVRPYALELAMCRRYYQRVRGGVAAVVNSGSVLLAGEFGEPMRVAPSMSLSDRLAITNNSVDVFQSAVGSPALYASSRGWHGVITNFSGLVAGAAYVHHSVTGGDIVAVAEL